MIVVLVIFFLAIIAWQVPDLIRARMWKELAVYLVLLSLAVTYSVGQVYHWPLPNPTKRVEYMFEPVSQMLDQVLK